MSVRNLLPAQQLFPASYSYNTEINAYIEPFAYTDTYYFYYVYYNDPSTYADDVTDTIMCYNYNAGQWVSNAFVCDGTYTYYVQYDGTAMFIKASLATRLMTSAISTPSVICMLTF